MVKIVKTSFRYPDDFLGLERAPKSTNAKTSQGPLSNVSGSWPKRGLQHGLNRMNNLWPITRLQATFVGPFSPCLQVPRVFAVFKVVSHLSLLDSPSPNNETSLIPSAFDWGVLVPNLKRVSSASVQTGEAGHESRMAPLSRLPLTPGGPFSGWMPRRLFTNQPSPLWSTFQVFVAALESSRD